MLNCPWQAGRYSNYAHCRCEHFYPPDAWVPVRRCSLLQQVCLHLAAVNRASEDILGSTDLAVAWAQELYNRAYGLHVVARCVRQIRQEANIFCVNICSTLVGTPSERCAGCALTSESLLLHASAAILWAGRWPQVRDQSQGPAVPPSLQGFSLGKGSKHARGEVNAAVAV